MFTLTLLNSPPPEALKSQVVQMVVDYFSDISPVSLRPSNPLYQLYQYVIGYQIHLYLHAMDSARQNSAQLILALDDQDPSQVLGFALYLPSKADSEACTLVSMAVQTGMRRRGVARAMLQRMLSRHPQAELACVAGQVPIFAAMGFQVLAAQGPQVLMSTRDYRADGMAELQDLTPIYQSAEVRQIHAYLVKQHGRPAMSAAEKQRDRLLDQMSQRAQALVREHQL
jgi:N-acetylglutamate synthase-like GNAT family acetyltransferase